MKVYRVALPPTHPGNSRGEYIGPYRGGSESWDEDVRGVAMRMGRTHCDSKHPTPWTDVPGGINPDEYCVFADTERLNDWFQHFGFDLEEAGYMVVVYEVGEGVVRRGVYQDVAVVTDDDIVSVDSPLGYIH